MLIAPHTDPEGSDVGADTGLGFPGDGPAALLDQLEEAGGPADPVPSADGWELVLAESVAYLVDDRRRWQALADLRRVAGLDPAQILAAPEAVLREVVAGARPAVRVERLRRCAELAIAGAPWRAYPGIGRPGRDRIDLFTGSRAVLALDANGLRVLTRLGYADPARVLQRRLPAGASCAIAGDCPSAGHPPPLY